jgi:hypothetical protein
MRPKLQCNEFRVQPFFQKVFRGQCPARLPLSLDLCATAEHLTTYQDLNSDEYLILPYGLSILRLPFPSQYLALSLEPMRLIVSMGTTRLLPQLIRPDGDLLLNASVIFR